MVKIQEKWERKSLSEILTVRHGKNQHNVSVEYGEYPILATGGQIGWAKEYLYDKPSVLIGRKGTINKPQFIEKPFWTIDTLFYTEIKEQYNPKYIYYLFQKIDWLSLNEASGVPSLSSNNIERVKVNIPNLENQNIIVEILSDMDELIESLEKIIDKKKKIKQGTMQQLLTGKKRLPGFSGKWKKFKLSDVIVKFQNGYAFSSSDYEESGVPIITMAQIGLNGQFNINENNVNYVSNELANMLPNFIVENNDVIIAMTDVTPQKNLIGRMTITKDIRKALLNQRVGLIKLDEEIVIPKLIVELSNMDRLRSYFKSIASLGVQSNISTHEISKAVFSLPSDIKEQQAIAEILSDMDAEIEHLEQKLEKYKKLKEGMMQELLTGRIRLV